MRSIGIWCHYLCVRVCACLFCVCVSPFVPLFVSVVCSSSHVWLFLISSAQNAAETHEEEADPSKMTPEEVIAKAVKLFNAKPKHGIQFMQKAGKTTAGE